MDPQSITQLLHRMAEGESAAADELLPAVYEELRRLAHNQLIQERNGHTLSATALVHEAYLKLVDQQDKRWQNRGHFFAVASLAMRRILVDHARTRLRAKRGGNAQRVEQNAENLLVSDDRLEEVLTTDQLLDRLRTFDARAAQIVQCRFFAGLTIEETGEALGIAPMTVKRSWRLAKTWLRREAMGGNH